MSRPKLAISFSGGRTSALMMKLCLERYGDSHDIAITFANTGCEHPNTIDFVNQCDRFIAKGRVVWLEAVVDPAAGLGVTHKIVDYKTASRKGEPFEAYISKYGIPNMTNPSCTARLKTDVMESYLRSIGFVRGKKINYDTAIGIGADEMDRVSSRYKQERWVYPLVDAGIRKSVVLAFWKAQTFNLDLRGEHYGNCVWCWKKSLRKHLTLAVESPEVFEFPLRMEQKYGEFKANTAAGKDGVRRFFRKHLSVADIIAMSKQPFEKYADAPLLFNHELDLGSGCGETCEIGADEQ